MAEHVLSLAHLISEEYRSLQDLRPYLAKGVYDLRDDPATAFIGLYVWLNT